VPRGLLLVRFRATYVEPDAALSVARGAEAATVWPPMQPSAVMPAHRAASEHEARSLWHHTRFRRQ
jgi:hypothetical protein